MPVPTISGIAIPLRKFHDRPVPATNAFTSASAATNTITLIAASRTERNTTSRASSNTTLAGKKIT